MNNNSAVSSFKKLETVFAAAAAPSSPANPTFSEIVSKSEAIVRENLLLQERVDFLESASNAFKNQALVWKKVAVSSQGKKNQKINNKQTSSSPFLFADYAKSEQQLIAKFGSTPEAVKLKQLCAQVNS